MSGPIVELVKVDTFTGAESPIAIAVDHVISVSIDGAGNTIVSTPLGGTAVRGTVEDVLAAIRAASV